MERDINVMNHRKVIYGKNHDTDYSKSTIYTDKITDNAQNQCLQTLFGININYDAT